MQWLALFENSYKMRFALTLDQIISKEAFFRTDLSILSMTELKSGILPHDLGLCEMCRALGCSREHIILQTADKFMIQGVMFRLLPPAGYLNSLYA